MTDTLALMAAGFMHAISPINLLAMLASTIVGITIGCLPGLSAAMGVALLLPVTFGMDPATGLIVLGGIGFLTWDDVWENRLHIRRYRMQSKVILVTTVCLILLPALFFFLADYSALPIGKRLLASFFQAVSPRTAGFNTMDLTAMTEASRAMMILLMLVGGSPGSTAGGMKTTTLAVLLANAVATFRRRESPQFFGRRVGSGAVKTAATI